MADNQGKYLYGFVNANEGFSLPSSLAEQKVSALRYGDLAAIVTDAEEIDLPSLKKEAILRKLAVHQSVIEKVMKERPTLPAKFGTVLESNEETEEFLQKVYPEVRQALNKMGDKVEIDLVVLWNGRSVIEDILAEDEEVLGMKRELKDEVLPATAMSTKVELGKRVYQLLRKKREKYAEEILKTLKEEAEDSQVNRILPDEMVLNVAFLIEPHGEKNLDLKIQNLNEKYGERLNFRCVGPLPPYSFFTLEVNKISPGDLDRSRQVLGVNAESLTQLKQHYHQLTLKYHPDSSADANTEGKFAEIKQAYELLSNYFNRGRFWCQFLKLNSEV